MGKPIIFITSDPYGDRESGKTAGDFLVSGHRLEFDPEVSIVSTYFWDRLPGARRPLERFILHNLATAVLMKYADLQFHPETPKCPFFTSVDPKEIPDSFDAGDLCAECEGSLQMRLSKGDISVEKVAAAKRLFNTAWRRKTCFVVMPFQRKLENVYKKIARALTEEGWKVHRGDEIVQPRRITDAILEGILTSDLVVADLTGNNPNVFYELGFADAIGRNVIMLTQEERMPFDVAAYRAIFYKSTTDGLREMDRKLRRQAGKASS
jgi:nucleoside 2-deoxyribosyltransferase